MMDELELLRRDWKKNDNQFTQVNENDIYKMQFKSSSSVVKWIFIISLIELLLAPVLSIVFNSDKTVVTLEKYHIKTIVQILSILNYAVIIYFIVKFYKNYKTINATDSVKDLLKNILNTRKTVKQYVSYNLFMGLVMFIVIFVAQANYEPAILKLMEKIGGTKGYVVIFIAYTIVLTVFMVLFWLFYKLIYGLLIKRLNRNYKELEKLDF